MNYYVTLIDKYSRSKIIIGEISASSLAWCKSKARSLFLSVQPHGNFYDYHFKAKEIKDA